MSAFKQWGNFLANLCNSSGYILSSPLLLGTNTIAVVLLCSIRIIFSQRGEHVFSLEKKKSYNPSFHQDVASRKFPRF